MVIGGHDYVPVAQTPGALASWNPVKRLVFASSIALVQEPGNPQQNQLGQPLGQLASASVLSDVVPIVTRGDELASGQVIYNPTAEYRFVQCTSSGPLTTLDWQVYWMDVYGGSHPVYLSHGGSTTAKILFRHI